MRPCADVVLCTFRMGVGVVVAQVRRFFAS